MPLVSSVTMTWHAANLKARSQSTTVKNRIGTFRRRLLTAPEKRSGEKNSHFFLAGRNRVLCFRLCLVIPRMNWHDRPPPEASCLP